MNQKPKPAP